MIDYSDNKTLFREIKAGNKGAFVHLYKRYFFRLRGYAAKFINEDEVVSDIIQETFLVVWEKRKQLGMVSLSSLLFTIVRNHCLNHLKHQSIALRYIEDQTLLVQPEEEYLYHIDFGLDPSQKLLQKELQEQIEIVMEQLPERCREVFLLSRKEGLKNREIAAKLNISITAVEKHIRRALSYFSDYFKTRYPIDLTLFLILLLSICPMI